MKYIQFAWSESTSLATEIAKPFKKISVHIEREYKNPVAMTFWRSNGVGLKLYSVMHDVAERIEVGVLSFTYVDAPSQNETIIELGSAFNHELTVLKLIIHEADTTAESGLILKSPNGSEMIIVAADFPYLLAIRGVESMSSTFTPEYPLDRYERIRMS